MTRRLPLLAAALLLQAACAAVPTDPVALEGYREANDPLEPFNRAVFAFNLEVDRVALEPAARGYRRVVPEEGRNMIARFLHNLRSPVIFVNDVLQFQFHRAGETLASFLINSTLGVAGLYDVAGTPPHEEDLGQTLAVWRLGEGPYLVIPFHGPTNPRDLAGVLGDRYFDPMSYAIEDPERSQVFAARVVVQAVDDRERVLEEFNELRRASLDFYSTARSLYRQSRGFEIRNGAPAPLPEYDFEP